MIYLGEYNSPESRQKWAEVVTDWSAGNLDKYGSAVSVARLAVAYTKHAQNYYRKDGKRTSEACRVGSALKFLVAECWDLQTDKFTPKHLERVRNRMIRKKLSRNVINGYISIITRAFKFGVVEGCVPAPVWMSLKALPGLRLGRSKATETAPVEPVPSHAESSTDGAIHSGHSAEPYLRNCSTWSSINSGSISASCSNGTLTGRSGLGCFR